MQYNYSVNDNGTTVSYGSFDADYGVDVISRKVATFIKDTTNQPNKPFFAWVAPYIPHEPAPPPSRYIGKYAGAHAPRTASFNEADVSDKPDWIQKSKPLLTATQIANMDELYEKRRESLLAVTDLVQNVIATLTAQGVLDNTYIFFTSDNGFHQGQHRLRSGKGSAYEEDLNVPLVVRGPGVPAGQVVKHFTLNIDLAPTFAELAGVTPPSFVDGRSLVPFLKGLTPAPWRRAILHEHIGPSTLNTNTTDGLLEPQDAGDVQALATGGSPVYLGLRTKPVIKTAKNPTGYGPLNYVAYDTGEHELYDIVADPAQLDNSFNSFTSADPELRQKLDAWINSLRYASGQALRDAEQTVP